MGVENKRSLTLIITEKCDLSCIYCYEHDKSAKQMTFQTAKEILDRELKNLNRYEYSIEFFGGEPFLNFPLIKEVVDYVVENYHGNYHFFATSNGTQIHGEIQDWLIEHAKIFTVGLSLDGNEVAHNINRSNSFSKIDLHFFKKMYPYQSVKMTISKQSLPYLADSIAYLTNLGFLISCNLAYMVDWLASDNLKLLNEELDKIISFYIKNPDAPRCSMFDFHIEILSCPVEDEKHFDKHCGCGTHMRCYGVDGEAYPCQLFSSLSAGEKAIKSCDFHVQEKIDKNLFTDICSNCYFQRLCQTCLGSNYLSTGNMFEVDKERCKLYKIIYSANAKLKALEWEMGKFDPDTEQALLSSILKINSLDEEI